MIYFPDGEVERRRFVGPLKEPGEVISMRRGKWEIVRVAESGSESDEYELLVEAVEE